MTVSSLRRLLPIAAVLAVACQDGTGPKDDGLSLDIGGVQPSVTGTTLSIPGGSAGGEYTLVAFNGSETFSSTATVTFTGTNLGAAPAIRSMSPLHAEPLANLSPAFGGGPTRSSALDMKLRREERKLTNRFSGARQWFASRTARSAGLLRNSVPANLNVGDVITLNASTGNCNEALDPRQARVVAIRNRAVVLADVSNPAGGFTDAEYASYAAAFDTLIAPVDEANFKAPAGLNGDNRVLMFFTRAVNELTPANVSFIYGGFFFGRDLFPTTSTATLEGCASSNIAQMFYLLVPDPNGAINNNRRTKGYVDSTTIGTIAHEYQHLINASRRLYVNLTAEDFEETWLNEGLSHIAEELLFYRASGLAPRQNLGESQVRATQKSVNAYNDYQRFNFGRYTDYLDGTALSSPWAPDDELGTRGATWSLLRYLVDRRNSTDATYWQKLVDTPKLGFDNLESAFGLDVMNQARDWAVSVYADDYPGITAPPEYQQLSWNVRSIFAATGNTAIPFPTSVLSGSTPATVTVKGGGVAYVRFSVPANQTAQITWGAGQTLPSTLQVSAIRVR